jgi:hypothetical protein
MAEVVWADKETAVQLSGPLPIGKTVSFVDAKHDAYKPPPDGFEVIAQAEHGLRWFVRKVTFRRVGPRLIDGVQVDSNATIKWGGASV